MSNHRWWKSVITCWVAILVAVSAMAGCATDKGPAEAAIAAAEAAVNAAVGEASTYLPERAKSLQAGLAALKEKFSKGDYTAAMTDAKALTDRAKEVAAAASAKKAELAKTWENLSAGMPRVVETIKGRVEILSQSKKLPANMTKDKLASAKSGLGEITQEWTAATEAAKGGNLVDAIAKGTSVKAKAADVLTTLGMPVPDALRG
jgi:hypothetical protein